ncbi:MAG: HupE/UreJ family protein [Methylotenera sp.]|nr:HupE/UreJ family protein [Methylotenera sp.]
MWPMMRAFKFTPLLLILVLLLGLAYAHVGAEHTSGWMAGMQHPFSGLDHLCAMVAAGLWARQLGGRAVWFVPCTFVLVMALAGLLGMVSIPLPFIEGGILLSLLVLGFLVALAIQLPLIVSAAIVGIFALFHGYAHGVEMPHSISGLVYALGFMFATAILHLMGIAAAAWFAKIGHPQWLRLSGAFITLFGGTLYFVG